MPNINVAQFRAQAHAANPTLGRLVRSSLQPLLDELGPGPMLVADAARIWRLQEQTFRLPFDRQTKYRAALALLQPAGLVICGRPVEPSMHFVRFDTGPYMYVGIDANRKPTPVTLDPGSLHHVFDFKWKSSTGHLLSLARVWTREHVRFRTSQRAPPFNDVMPVEMDFHWGESQSASSGFGRDDHSIKPPRLVCRHPWVAGENVAEQWYQYSLDGRVWQNIPGAAYLLTKGVRQAGQQWVFFFRKSNWAPHNTKVYCFEAEYRLGHALPSPPQPAQSWMRTNGTPSEVGRYGRVISHG